MKANSEKTKQSKKATRRVLAGVLCGASVLSLVLSLVMPPISQAIANDAQAGAAEETVTAADSSTESTDIENTNNGDTENQNSDETEGDETNPTNDVEQNQAEDQFEDEQRGEDGETSDDNAVKAVAEGGQAEMASGEIDNIVDSGDELKNKLRGPQHGVLLCGRMGVVLADVQAALLAAGLLRSLRSPWAIALPGLRRSTDWCFVCPPVGAPA